MIVGIDRIAAGSAIDASLRAVDGRDGDLAAHVFQREPLGDELRGIDLDPDRGFLLTADEDLGDAGNLADLLRQMRVGVVADLRQRHGIRRRRQQQDRRIGRVYFAVGRRVRKVLRQLAARRIDRALYVVRCAIDAAIEVELNGDGGRSQRTRRGHLSDAGNLRELSFQRLGYRGRHRFRASAGQAGGNLDGRKIDLRQRRDRQERVGNQADEQNASHQQRGCDRIPNEGR